MTPTSAPAAGPACEAQPLAATQSNDRLLRGLSAQVAPGGVTLCWLVDEARAGAITGFSCGFRSPAHLALGVAGSVPCWDRQAPGTARELAVDGLPEYGEYVFELVAQTSDVSVGWPQRALVVTVAVTPELAGPPGPAGAVSGAGPLVTGCGPGGGPSHTSADAPWDLGQMVSGTHVAHLPGRGWWPTGDGGPPPQWPEAPSLDELFDEAGLDGGLVAHALGGAAASRNGSGNGSGGNGSGDNGGGADDAQVIQALSQQALAAVIDRAAADSRALLRPGPGGAGWELLLHSSLPFGGVYAFDAAHAVAGWGHDGQGATGAGLWHRTDCPPPVWPDATHHFALALSHDAGEGGILEHSGYGWWAVAPVGRMPERVVAYKSALSYGEPASPVPHTGTVWQGRASGHLFWERQRWALGGKITLEFSSKDGQAQLSGRIDDAELVPLDPDTLEPAGLPQRWRTLSLEAGAFAGAASGTGPVSVGPAAADEPPGMPAPGAFEGDWRAAAHGPNGSEIAGQLRLWTPLADSDEPAEGWPAQALVVAGFGGAAR